MSFSVAVVASRPGPQHEVSWHTDIADSKSRCPMRRYSGRVVEGPLRAARTGPRKQADESSSAKAGLRRVIRVISMRLTIIILVPTM